jgi:hypothetical protein
MICLGAALGCEVRSVDDVDGLRLSTTLSHRMDVVLRGL